MTTGNRVLTVFTESQRELLTAVLDRLIPAEGRMPGAGEVGVVEFVEGVAVKNLRLRRLFIEGLAHIEITAMQSGAGEFQDLADAAKDETLRQVEAAHSTFFQELVSQTYNGYYTNPQVFEIIDYSIPNPEDYRPEPFDESLLKKQRQRAPFWRPA